ncbi:hypothetical protein [Rhodococcus baikonurensis]|uniref:Uncharacterized protein n=1 Tax=Rhodococcus baikonurensis TaxID=172041 RepID=A0ABV5XDZ1_9NOCA
MLIGLGFLAFAITFHLFAARIAAGEGYGRQLPAASSASSSRFSRQVRRAQTVGWVLSIVGTVRIVSVYWVSEPLLAGGLAVVVLGLVNGLPSLAVNALCNRKQKKGTSPQ